MIYIWKSVIPATVEEVVKDLRQEVISEGLMKDINDTGADIMCTCPFHKGGRESKPSMGISKYEVDRNGKHYEAGTVHCYTCGYTADLPKFVAELLSLGNALNGYKHLIRKYSYGEGNSRGEISFNFERDVQVDNIVVDGVMVTYFQEQLLKSEKAKAYLSKRKLIEAVCLEYGLGYNSENDSIVMPIRDRKGTVLLLKERSIEGKAFYNTKGSNKAGVIYGLYEAILNNKPDEWLWITESEIDALTLRGWGVQAIAIMGSHISDFQIKELCKTKYRKIVLALDNDDAGRKGCRILKDELIPLGFRIKNIRWTVDKKDINELNYDEFGKLEFY